MGLLHLILCVEVHSTTSVMLAVHIPPQCVWCGFSLVRVLWPLVLLLLLLLCPVVVAFYYVLTEPGILHVLVHYSYAVRLQHFQEVDQQPNWVIKLALA